MTSQWVKTLAYAKHIRFQWLDATCAVEFPIIFPHVDAWLSEFFYADRTKPSGVEKQEKLVSYNNAIWQQCERE